MKTQLSFTQLSIWLVFGLGLLVILGMLFTPFRPVMWNVPAMPEIVEKKLTLASPELEPIWAALAKVDRAALGFTPFPIHADEVRYTELIGGPAENADVSLSIYYAGKSRLLDFEREGNGLRWVGEMETFNGPNQYPSVWDAGEITVEQISLECYRTCAANPIPANLRVSYVGADARLITPQEVMGTLYSSGTSELTLAQVQPILLEWASARPNP